MPDLQTDIETDIAPWPPEDQDEPDGRRPPRRVIGGSASGWLVLAAVGLFFLVAGLALWYALAPLSLARLAGRLGPRPLTIKALALTVDRRPLEIPAGGALAVNLRQKIALGRLISDRWLNYGLSLSSPDFDPATISGGASAAPAAFLDASTFNPTTELRLIALDDGRPAAAEFKILVQYEARDYAAWAALTRDPLKRLEIYEKILELDPGFPGARASLAAELRAAGRLEPAAGLYEEALALGEGDEAETLVQLLDLYIALDQEARQEAALNRLLALNRGQGRPLGPALARAAGLFERQGRLPRALALLEKLSPASSPGEEAEILGELAFIHRRRGDAAGEAGALKRLGAIAPPEKAGEIFGSLRALAETAGDEAGRLAALKALAALLPAGLERAAAQKTIGLLAARAGDYEGAAAAYGEALKLDPDDALTRLNLARVAALAGRREAYRAGLAALAAQYPDNQAYLTELAGALREDGLWPQAKERYLALAAASPEDWAVRLKLLECLEKTGDRAGLLAQYALLAALRPDDRTTLYNYGALLFEQKNWDEAGAVFLKFLALPPGGSGDEGPGEDAAREYLLAIYQRQGKSAEMLEQALALYRRDPSKVVYRAFVLNTYENAKDWPHFAEAAAECAGLRRDDPEAWRQLARGQAKLSLKTEAAQSLWLAAEADRNRPEPWLAAGDAFAALGDLERGRTAYRRVLSLDPQNKKAVQALMELDRKSEGRGG